MMEEHHYAGFWIRVGAALIDTILMMAIIVPLVFALYGKSYWQSDSIVMGYGDFLINYFLPAIVVIVFWFYKSATPGKMVLKLQIVDAKTGGKPTVGQCVVRYLGYYVASIPLLIGIIWVAFDSRKQGWHDKMAGTIVVKKETK